MDNKIFLDLETGEPREKMITLIRETGLSEEEIIEILDTSIDISKKLLSSPKFSQLKQFFRNLLPRLILSQLGEKFTKEERLIIRENFPQEGGLNLEQIQDPQTRKIMEKFAYSMKDVIGQMVKYRIDMDKQN